MASPEIFDIPIGKVVGPRGDTGNGIDGIELLSTSGLQKTYRINMTNETHFDFVVTDGNGISGASFDAETNELTITFDNGTSFTTPSLKGAPGDPGDDGYSPTVTIDTITGGHRITITDKTHPTGQSFDVLDGASDAGSVSYDPEETYQSGTVGAELQHQSRQLNDETTGLDTKAPLIINTASGAIASFSDGADSMPIKKLVAQIEPVQDLHGQDSPYPAGGGKNLVNIADSTTPITAQTTISDNLTLPAGTYILSADVNNTGAGGFRVNLRTVSGSVNMGIDGVTSSEGWVRKSSQVITLPEDGEVYLYCNGSVSGYSGNYKNIMLCKSTATDPTVFAPYSNLCPISGHTGAEIEQTGVNLWDEQWEVGQIDPYTGEPTSANDRIRSKNYIRLEPSTTFYVVSDGMGSNDFRMCFYDKYKNFIAVGSWQYSSTFTTPDNAYYGKFVRVNTTTYNNNISINYPATDTTYHPYTGNQISVTFPETIYGGEAEVISGKLKRTLNFISDLSTLTWYQEGSNSRFYAFAPVRSKQRGRCWCSIYPYNFSWTSDKVCYIGEVGTYNQCIVIQDSAYTSATDLRAALSGVQLCYEIETPIEYTTEPQTLDTLYGTNNIWANTGDVEVEYPCDTKLYVDNKITQAIAAALNA